MEVPVVRSDSGKSLENSTGSTYETDPQPGYFRTVISRGNSFVVRPPATQDVGSSTAMGDSLYVDTLRMSAAASKKADIMRGINIAFEFITIVSSIVIGVLTWGCWSQDRAFIAATLGFIIAAIRISSNTFSLEKRSVITRDTAAKLRSLAREIVALRSQKLTIPKFQRRLERLAARVDDLDLVLFDNSITSFSVEKNTRVNYGSHCDMDEISIEVPE
jgi:hypothetical protein